MTTPRKPSRLLQYTPSMVYVAWNLLAGVATECKIRLRRTVGSAR